MVCTIITNHRIYCLQYMIPIEEDDWNIIIEACNSLAAKWELISGYLGLPPSLIDKIRGNHPGDNISCLNDALLQWIKQNYNVVNFGEPSWKTLLQAIAKVDKLYFKKLAADHQGKNAVYTM